MQAVIAKMEDYRRGSDQLTERTLKTQELLNASIGDLAKIMRENNRIGQITNKSMQMGKVDEGKTVGGMLSQRKESFKDFFTARGFLEKSGMVKRGSGGLIDTALRKRQERQEFIEARKMVDPNMKNMKQFGGSDRKLDAYLGEQYEKSRSIRLDMQKNQDKVKQLQELGFTETQIARSAPGKAQAGLEAQLAKVDTRFRPNDLKVAEKKPGTSDQNENPVKKLLKRDDLTTNEEEKENMAWKDQQLDILAGIKDNTANMSELLGDMFSLDKKEALEDSKESKPGGMFDSIKSALGGAAMAGGGLLRGAGGATARFLGGTGGKVLGGVGLAAMAGYGAYQDFGDINQRLEAGEITQAEATIEKGGATGKAAGTIGGGLAGAKLGAMAGAAIGSVVPGIGTAIGGLVGSIIGGIGGAFAGSKFGKVVGETITRAGMQLFSLADEYIIQPIKNLGTKIGNIFDEYIYQPLAKALEPITNWFSSLMDDMKKFFHDMEIPGISFTNPITGTVYSVGPWYPFRKEEAESEGEAAPAEGASPPASATQNILDTQATADSSQASVDAFTAENGAPNKVVGYDPLGDAIMGYEDAETQEKYEALTKERNVAASKARRARQAAIDSEGGVDREQRDMSLDNMSAKFNYLQGKGIDMSNFETSDSSNALTIGGKMYNPYMINAAYKKVASAAVDSRVAKASEPMVDVEGAKEAAVMSQSVAPSMSEEEMREQGSMTQAPEPNVALMKRRLAILKADGPKTNSSLSRTKHAERVARLEKDIAAAEMKTSGGEVTAKSAANADTAAAKTAEPPQVVVQNNNNTNSSQQTIAPAKRSRNDDATLQRYYQAQFAG